MILIDQKDFEILKEIFAKLAVVLQHCDYSVAEEALLAKQIKGLHALGQTTPKGVNEEETSDSNNANERHFIKFTEKEILKMPKKLRRYFRAEREVIFYRKRIRGLRSCSYEARYHRHGYNISVSAPNVEELKQRFIEALRSAEEENALPKVPTTFDAFAQYYFENFRKRKQEDFAEAAKKKTSASARLNP